MRSDEYSPGLGDASMIIKKTGRWLWSRVVILGAFVAIIWILEFIDSLLLGQALNGFGIRPRNIDGLWGIPFAPFLHAGFAHAASNTVPFLALGWFVMLRRRLELFLVSIVAIVIGGFGTWLIGASNSVHIGASGMIYGYLGFLLFRGVFERSFPAIALSLVTGVLYGGLIFGVLPGQVGISWQGHLFGFSGGVLAARILSRRNQTRQSRSDS